MADLTDATRRNLNPSQFALPAKAKSPTAREHSGNYPIPDEAHARAALSLVARHGTPDEQRAVREAVHKKFPGIQ